MKRSLLLVISALSVASLPLGIGSLGVGGGAMMASASSFKACSDNSFWGAWVGKNGATGTIIYDVAFINDGHTSCRLSGYPTIDGFRNGREQKIAAGHLMGKVFDLFSTTVAPRMIGEMVLTTGTNCNALNSGSHETIQKVIADNSYGVGITFPHSTGAVIVNGLTIDVACGLNITGLGWR